MITIRSKGDFSKATRYFKRVKEAAKVDVDKTSKWICKDRLSQFECEQGSQHSDHIAVRTWYWDRRLGRRERLHQPCYPAYF